MIKSQLLFLFISLIALPGCLFSQDTIYLNNPSFEDKPRIGTESSAAIKGWTDCPFPGESPADIYPTSFNAFGVALKARDGLTYLGLVARYNSTWEYVSQKLSHPLKDSTCYTFTASLAMSGTYNSRTKRSELPENFSHALVLQIWGGSDHCHRGELLAVSPPINNNSWEEFSFVFKPKASWDHLLIAAYYYYPSTMEETKKMAYNGHILVDNITPVVETLCEKIKE